jgi:arylsulfatase A-like enzyme
MKPKLFISLVAFLMFVLGTLTVLKASDFKKGTRPNIIFILTDDLGAGDLHCTGHPCAKSPNLDKLAEQGIRFERAYISGALCAPSRFGLMSGQYPAREFDQTHNLRADEPCITQILKHAGYLTAHIGKWHLTERKNIKTLNK